MNNKRYTFNFLYNVEIEISSLCNRHCVYCPVAYIIRKRELFPLDIFEKIMKELAEINYSGGLAFHQYNEPLLEYEHLCKCIEVAKKYNKNIRLELYTNGDLLTKQKLRELRQLGIDRLVVTCQLDPNETWNKENATKKVENMLKKLSIHRGIEIGENIVSMKESKLMEYVYKLKEYGYSGVKKYPFKLQIRSQNFYEEGSSRMGVIHKEDVCSRDSKNTNYYCYSLLHGMHISYKGNVYMCCDCCEDTETAQKYNVGSVYKNRIYDIFAAKNQLIESYMKHESIESCKECYWNQ